MFVYDQVQGYCGLIRTVVVCEALLFIQRRAWVHVACVIGL